MKVENTPRAKRHYRYWCEHNIRIALKINAIVESIKIDPRSGLGSPKPLRGDQKGRWGRRIDHHHRLVYRIETDKVVITSMRGHYE